MLALDSGRSLSVGARLRAGPDAVGDDGEGPARRDDARAVRRHLTGRGGSDNPSVGSDNSSGSSDTGIARSDTKYISKNNILTTYWPLARPLLMRSVVNGTTNNQTGGANMFSINRIFFAGAVDFGGGGGVDGERLRRAGARHAAGRRGARRHARWRRASPKMIVAGPARLLHVDVHGHQALNLYSVKRDADGVVQLRGPGALRVRCRSGRREQRAQPRGAGRRGDLPGERGRRRALTSTSRGTRAAGRPRRSRPATRALRAADRIDGDGDDHADAVSSVAGRDQERDANVARRRARGRAARLVRVQGQLDRERRSVAGRALDRDRSAERVDDLLDDPQPQADAAVVAAGRGPLEAAEDALVIVRRRCPGPDRGS